MAASVVVYEYNGALPGAGNEVANVRYRATDAYASSASYPMVVPAAGTNYSYWKHVAPYAKVTPAGTIDNVKWYSDGTIGWTGVTLQVAQQSIPSYYQATGTAGTTGDEITANHCLASTVLAAGSYTSASPYTLGGSISNPNTGKITNYVVSQCDISTSASAGALGSETMTFRYDET